MRGDDASYGKAGGEGAGAAEVHGFGGHVGVLEAGAGVEEDDLVGGLEFSGGEELVVGCGGGAACGGEEDAYVAGEVEDAGEDSGVVGGDGLAAGLGENVEDDGVAVGLGDAEAGGEGVGVLEELAGVLQMEKTRQEPARLNHHW